MTKKKPPPRQEITTADRVRILASVEDLVATDPLSQVSRGERKLLLIIALVAVAVSKGGLVPSEVPALGITLQPQERLSLLYLISGVLCFYLVGFLLYGRADLKRRKAVLSAKSSEVRDIVVRLQEVAGRPRPSDSEEEQRWVAEIGEASEAIGLVMDVNRFARMRIGFDIYAPLLIGAIALALVLHETWAYPGGRAIGVTVAGSTVVTVFVLAWVRRKKIAHRLGVARHKYYFWRFKRLSRRIQALPEDSPRRKRLQVRVKPLIDKTLKGPWV